MKSSIFHIQMVINPEILHFQIAHLCIMASHIKSYDENRILPQKIIPIREISHFPIRSGLDSFCDGKLVVLWRIELTTFSLKG